MADGRRAARLAKIQGHLAAVNTPRPTAAAGDAAAVVTPRALRDWCGRLCAAAGMPPADVTTLCDMLVEQELMQVPKNSHGTRLLQDYLGRMVRDRGEGRVNPAPRITVQRSSPTARLYDGDGGLGHIVCAAATEWAIEAAKRNGCASAMTRNHFHFGAAGHYTRMAAREGCIAMALSSSRGAPQPGAPLSAGVPGPLSLGVPSAGQRPDFLLDGDVLRVGAFDETEASTPGYLGTKAKALGMEAWVHLMGGVVPGIYLSDVDEDSEFISNQGSFICVFSPEAFMAPEVYRAEMDRYIGTVESMEPWPGQER